MAVEKTVKKEKAPVVPKAVVPFRYYRVNCQWLGMVGGVAPIIPTLPGHIRRVLENEEARLAKEGRKKKPSEREAETDSTNGDESSLVLVTSDRRRQLEKALSDPRLDNDAKQVIRLAFAEQSPEEVAVEAVLRATNGFPRLTNGNLCVPGSWARGGLKAALIADGMFREQAQDLMKRGVSVHPRAVDLGKSGPDSIHDANVTLGRVGPGEAQSSIKRFQLVDPAPKDFTLIVQVLDSNAFVALLQNMQRLMTIVGEAGLGGGRPAFGRFQVIQCEEVKPEEAKALIAEIDVNELESVKMPEEGEDGETVIKIDAELATAL